VPKLAYIGIIPSYSKSAQEYFKLLKKYNEDVKLKKDNLKKPIHPYYLEMSKSPEKFLLCMLKMSNELEQTNKSQLQVLPMRSGFVPKYITLDTSSLVSLLYETPKENIKITKQRTVKQNKNNSLKTTKINKPLTPKQETRAKLAKLLEEEKAKKMKEREIQLKFQEDNKSQFQNKSEMLNNLTFNAPKIWGQIFKFNKNKIKTNRKHYIFDYLIKTDGISTTLQFKIKSENDYAIHHNKKIDNIDEVLDEFRYLDKLDKLKLKDLNNKYNIVGVDPGKKNILYMRDFKGEQLRYTSQQRRVECQMKKSNRVIHNEKLKVSHIQNLETELSKYSLKTVDIKKYKQLLQLRYIHTKALRYFYERDIYRKLRWRRFTAGQRSEMKLVNNIKETFGSDAVLLYGNWSRNTQMKYFYPTPNIGLRKRLGVHFKIYMIDEYKTSKTCHECKHENENKIYHKDKRHWKNNQQKLVHGVLCCTNINCNTTWNRDVNGSLNILEIGQAILNGKERPEVFRRTTISQTIQPT
jgi:hypothetical protein